MSVVSLTLRNGRMFCKVFDVMLRKDDEFRSVPSDIKI